MSLTEESMNLSSTRNDISKFESSLITQLKNVHSLKTPTYKPGLFYERMIDDFKSDTSFLREQLVLISRRDNFFTQFDSVYTKLLLHDEVIFCLIEKTVDLQNHHQISREMQVTQKFQ